MVKKKVLIEKREIKKSNNLIESSYKLTTSESRLIDLALTKLETIMLNKDITAEEVQDLINLSKFKEIEINVADYKKEYKLKSNALYEEMALTADRLLKRAISNYDVNTNKLTKKNWVITCVYDFDKCSVSIQFHPDLIPDLLVFKGYYTIFDFDVKKYLPNFSTNRLYELLRQYVRIGYRNFTIEEIRFYLGIDKDEYPNFSNLKQKIIIPAIKQINKVTDIYCEFEEVKEKSKIISINFKIISQKVQMIESNERQMTFISEEIAVDSENEIDEYRGLLGVTIGLKQIAKLKRIAKNSIKDFKLDLTVREYIKEKKIIVDEYGKRNKIESYLGMIIKAMQENWTMKGNVGRFNNFNQRSYDDDKFDEIEKALRKKALEV